MSESWEELLQCAKCNKKLGFATIVSIGTLGTPRYQWINEVICAECAPAILKETEEKHLKKHPELKTRIKQIKHFLKLE